MVQVLGDRGVAEPHRADGRETHQVGHLGWPLGDQRSQQIVLGATGNPDLEHEKRYRDGEKRRR